MKNLFLGLLVFGLSATASADTFQVLRTLTCTGTVSTPNGAEKAVELTMEDTRSTYTEGKIELEDYWSTMTLQNVNDDIKLKMIHGNVTSVEASYDVGEQRDAPRDGRWQGLTFYEMFEKAPTYDSNSSRMGLIVIATQCEVDVVGEEVTACPSPKDIRNYDLAIQYGEMNDPTVKTYSGKITCNITKK